MKGIECMTYDVGCFCVVVFSEMKTCNKNNSMQNQAMYTNNVNIAYNLLIS